MTTTQMLLIALGLAVVALALLFVLRQRRRPTGGLVDPFPVPLPPEPAEPEVPAAPLPELVALSSPFLSEPISEPDDLGQIKGIGPKMQTLLKELGVFHYSQIAEWTPVQLAAVDAKLGQFQGRPERDQWQSQARLLASGDRKAYERVHGKLGPDAAPGGGA